MVLDPELQQQLLTVFKSELKEHIRVITDGLLGLEKTGISSNNQLEVDEIFRAAHSLKGAARSVGLDKIVDLAHYLESILSLLNKGQMQISPVLVSKIMSTLDCIQDLVDDKDKGRYFELLTDLEKIYTSKGQIDLDPPTATKETVVENNNALTQASFNGQRVDEHYVVSPEQVNQLTVLAEDVLATKLEFIQYTQDMLHLFKQADRLSSELVKQVNFLPTGFDNEIKEALLAQGNQLSLFSEQTLSLYNDMRQTNSRFNLISQAVQNNAHAMRLLSFSILLNPLNRIIRDLAARQNKQVSLIIHGGDIEIDRNLFQTIFDPLVHIVTNAVAHGIETPEERQLFKKSLQAQIVIQVKKQGDMLLISVCDDGAGLDLINIKKKALELKLIDQGDVQNLTDDEVIALIFNPGFSSAEIISEISGRGVGLDVVRTNLRKINASIQVESIQGQGCTFTMLLPVSLSNEHGVLFKVADKHFAIQNIAIDSVMNCSFDDVLLLSGQQNIVVGNEPVPLYYLAQFLRMSYSASQDNDELAVVLLSEGDRKIALIVDEIVGEREFIVKPFCYPLVNVENTIGAALMGNGELVIVLNSIGLIASSTKMQVTTPMVKEEDEIVAAKILFADDSGSTRTLVKNILQNAGFQVSVAVNGVNAWEVLQNESFDLVITDVEMPLMNGFELVEKIKNHTEMRKIPVIIVTSLDSDKDKRRGIQVGADAYVTKGSFKSDLLLNIIEQLL